MSRGRSQKNKRLKKLDQDLRQHNNQLKEISAPQSWYLDYLCGSPDGRIICHPLDVDMFRNFILRTDPKEQDYRKHYEEEMKSIRTDAVMAAQRMVLGNGSIVRFLNDQQIKELKGIQTDEV
jgi:hypothetical protein